MGKPTVLIAEDEFLIAEGQLRPLLTPDFDIIGVVGDGIEALAVALEYQPKVVLLDISLPGMRGFEVGREILKKHPDCRILFVSCYTDQAYVDSALEMGASGYVLKSQVVRELVNAINTALGGQFYRPAL